MVPVATYKGKVDGVWASDARFTITDDNVEGLIITPSDSIYIEPARKYSTAAASTDYILYNGSDVRMDVTRSCADTLGERLNSNAQQIMSSATEGIAPAVFSPFKVAEIATESDFEYTTALGGSAAANNDILGIM